MKTYITWSIENYFWNKIEQLMFDKYPLLVYVDFLQKYFFPFVSLFSMDFYMEWGANYLSGKSCYIVLKWIGNSLQWYSYSDFNSTYIASPETQGNKAGAIYSWWAILI